MISVIVPVYNMEKYLCRCVDSILNQTYSDFELILVDDGSSDSSSKICDDYVEKDLRIRAIHKNNGGVSSARNEGLLKAIGKYVTFVDSDDYIEDTYLEKLYCAIIENHVDMSCVGIKNQDNKLLFEKFFSDNNYSQIGLDVIPEIGVLYTVWGRLFKKELLKDLKFEETIFYSEDALFVIKYLYQKENPQLYIIGEPLYTYVQDRVESAVNCNFNIKILSSLKAYDEILACVKSDVFMWQMAMRGKRAQYFHIYQKLLSKETRRRYKKEFYYVKREIVQLRKEGYRPLDKKENIIEFLYLYFYGLFRYYIKWKRK